MTDNTSARPRIAVVLSHPVQYYSPWFRWIASEGKLHLRVFYLWDFGVTEKRDEQFGRSIRWDVDLLGGYEHEFVPNVSPLPGTHRFTGLNNPELRDRLRSWRPDAVLLFGYAYRTHLGLILRPPAPLIFRGDSHLIGHRPTLLKKLVLRRLYARFAAVTYVGAANREYFRTFGVPDKRLHFAPHCVNAAHFTRTSEVEAEAARLHAGLDIGSRRVVLFAGKLLPAKRPAELLGAFLRVAPSDAALVFSGEGSELDTLRATAARHPQLTVRFLPFANQSEMPARYALADLFVLPSGGLYETWGLAVNEAMHLGVPCLVSDRVGCQRDLVTEGETGWVFAADDPQGLPAALGRALQALRGDTTTLRRHVAERIARYSYAAAARGLEAAVQAAIHRA